MRSQLSTVSRLFVVLCSAFTLSAQTNWTSLFNGRDLAGWTKYLSSPTADRLEPNVDPRNVFSVTQTDGAGAIHITGEVFGSITTEREFTNFHFRLEFKWGPKRWLPRADVGRDTGILYCCVGEPNPRTGWMTSVENNIMEKGVGQWWSVNGAVIDAEGEWVTPENELLVPYKKEGAGERNIVWRPGAPLITASSANGITPYFDVEYVFGNWNTVEVIFWGGMCIHVLNGHVNLVAVNPRHEVNGQWRALEAGKIQLQSEAAEVFYRKIEARDLREIPAEYLAQVPSPGGSDEGFLPLFIGPAALQWKQAGPGRFHLREGVASAEGGMGLWWHTGRTFTNFVLRGEFLQEQEGANSGVFVRFPDPGNDPWNAVRQGHEVEIGDPEAENPTWRTGSIYPFKAPTGAVLKPAGEWNSYEIVCRGQNYSVRLNGKLVTTWTDPEVRSSSGYIGLQNYDDGKTVRHRHVRVKEIW